MIPHFTHILVPVDFTEKNRPALEIAFDLAIANHARVTLLHVIETMDVAVDDELDEFYARLSTRAAAELESMSQRFAEAGVAVDRKTRFGKRLHEIVDDSIERKADLIIMTSHKLDTAQPFKSWATLSYQVSALCQCPVLLVK